MILRLFKTKFQKLGSLLSKARFAIGGKIKALFSKSRDDASFEEFEQLLFEADLGAKVASEMTEKVRKFLRKNPEASSDEILGYIEEELSAILPPSFEPKPLTAKPHIILIIGVNGSGKTTSIAKLAKHYQKQGKKVLLVAADTFRAAAIDQLATWAERLKTEVIRSMPKSDPASVVFDGITAAVARSYDVVLVDTAGRLHTKTDLMNELEKLKRVAQKVVDEAPHETLLVLDATTGQNALDQAEIFHRYTPIDGIILSKLDGTAKGGIVVAIQKELKIPVHWVGLGESVEDFAQFESKEFIQALLATNAE